MTALLFATVLLARPPQGPVWQTFRASSGRFKVLLPKKPTTKTEQTPPGPVSIFVVESGPNIFTLEDAPFRRAPKDDEAPSVTKLVVDHLVERSGGTLQSTSVTRFQGSPARTFRFNLGRHILRGFTVIAGKRNYTMTFGGTAEDVDGPDSKRFLGSLQILEARR